MKTGQEFHFFVPGSVKKSVTLDGDGNEDWIFEGIASTSNIDLFGDVVYPESFEKSLEFFRTNGVIYYNHNYAKKMSDEMMEAQTPIGRPIDAQITEEGLYIKAVLNKEHKLAQKIWKENLKNPDNRFSGGIGLSIGAKALGPSKREYSTIHKKYVNILPDLLLYEVSMTPTPVNPETKTWVSNNSFASVVKSLIDEGETLKEETISNVEYVSVKPEEVIFDKENNLLVVKSVVENEDGTKYVFEQTIDVKEDVRKAMAEEEKKIQEEETPEEDKAENPFGGEQTEEQEAPAEKAPEGDQSQEGGEVPQGQEEGSPIDAIMGEDSAGGNPEEAILPGSENEEAQTDEGMSLILDKLDTVVDTLTTLVQDMAAQKQSTTGGVDSTDIPPTPSNEDVLKSMEAMKLEIFTNTEENIRTVVKSVIEETLPSLLTSLTSETVNKSVTRKDTPKIVQPPVELASVLNEDGSRTVIKSFSGTEVDSTILKGLIEDYTSIKGGNLHTQSSKRAQVLVKVNDLGLDDAEFFHYVRENEKGTLKF